MRQVVGWSAVLILVSGLVGGCSKAKSTVSVEASEVAKLWTEATTILADVTDRQTAQEAKPKLLEVGAQLKQHVEEHQKRQPAGATKARKSSQASEAQKKMLKEVGDKFNREQSRVSMVDGGKELLQAFYDSFK